MEQEAHILETMIIILSEVAMKDVKSAEAKVSAANTSIEKAKLDIQKAKADISKANANIENAKAVVEEAKAYMKKVKANDENATTTVFVDARSQVVKSHLGVSDTIEDIRITSDAETNDEVTHHNVTKTDSPDMIIVVSSETDLEAARGAYEDALWDLEEDLFALRSALTQLEASQIEFKAAHKGLKTAQIELEIAQLELKKIQRHKKRPSLSPFTARLPNPMIAFNELVQEEVSYKTALYLHVNEPDLLRLGALHMLSVDEAVRALQRARSRVRTETILQLENRSLGIQKVLATQRRSRIYFANMGTLAVIGKFFVKDAASDFMREHTNCVDIPPHPAIVKLVYWQRFSEEQAHCGVLFFRYYHVCLRDFAYTSMETIGDDILSIAEGVISGLNHLHKHRFIHCDIKPGNVMFDQDGKAIIIDLGSTVRTGEDVMEHTPSYSLGFHEEGASARLDWICTAVTLYNCCTDGSVSPSSIEELISFGEKFDHPIGKVIKHLCMVTSDEIEWIY